MARLNQITVSPLSKRQKANIVKSLNKVASELDTGNVQLFLEAMSKVIANYLKDYDRVWDYFRVIEQKASKIGKDYSAETQKLRARGLSPEQQKALKKWYAQAQWLDISDNETKIQELIYVLQRGRYILQYLQEQFTGQTIHTTFHIKSGETVVSVAEEDLPMSVVLSTYSASGENYVSLAYQLDGEMNKIIAELEQNKKASVITGDVYWNAIWDAKETKGWSRKFYDSKDAEIYEYLRQHNQTSLSAEEYTELRSVTGAGPGAREALQGGDIADEQMKLISERVDFARQTYVINNLRKLQVSLGSQNAGAIKSAILELFTKDPQNELEQKIDDGYTSTANKHIQEIFKFLDIP